MKKLTILKLEAVVKNDCAELIARIYELSRQMKDCREKIVHYKKAFELELRQFKDYTDDYVNYVSGKSLQDPTLLNFSKIRLGDYEQEILETRKFIRVHVKKLYELRKQNSELFRKLFDTAKKKAVAIAHENKPDYQQQQHMKIVLNNSQARQVFNKLYDLLDSGEYFEKVTIEVG